MKKIIGLLAVVVVIVIIFIAAAPASWVLYQAQKVIPSLQVSGVSGSAWRGQVSDAQIHSRGNVIVLGKVNWQFEWPTLLSLTPCLRFSTEHHEQTSRGKICISPLSQAVNVTETYATLPASLLATLFGVEIDGEFDGALESLKLEGQQLTQLNMDVIWRNAKFNNSEVWIPLGELLITATDDQQGGVVARWSDNRVNGQLGPLGVDVTTRLSADQAINVSGFVEPRASASRAMSQTLDLISQRDRNNRYPLDVSI